MKSKYNATTHTHSYTDNNMWLYNNDVIFIDNQCLCSCCNETEFYILVSISIWPSCMKDRKTYKYNISLCMCACMCKFPSSYRMSHSSHAM